MGTIAKLKEEEWAKDIDFELIGRGCEGQIGVSMKIINSAWYSKQLDATIEAAKKKLSSE